MKYLKFTGCFLLLFSTYIKSLSQTTLNADGKTETYELINSVLAPGYNVVETPDCIHQEVKHVDQIYDSVLQKFVFRFLAHKYPDNDRCKVFDRQRTEIKTYDKSPSYLKATKGEKVIYKWRFKISSDFQPSAKFTHLHQIKAVGGEDASMPLITLTARKANPNRLELRYAEETTQTTLAQVQLDGFQGEWVEAEEIILFQEAELADYSLSLTRMSDSIELFNYSSSSLKMWKTNADFLRPKWGIYRSLQDSNSLKDENVYFSDFSIQEVSSTVSYKELNRDFVISPNPAYSHITISPSILNHFKKVKIMDMFGREVLSMPLKSNLDVSLLNAGAYVIHLYNHNSSNIFVRRFLKK